MNDVAGNLQGVRAALAAAARAAGRLAVEVQLLAVSKTQPAAAVRAAFAAGQRAFGENRVQELAAKTAELVDVSGLQWHLIGSLQTNKVRELLAVPGLTLLHSLDRPRLADELQRELHRLDRTLAVLVQVHATGEATKHGCPPDAVPALVEHVLTRCPRLRIEGLMAIGPLAGDPAPVFAAVAGLRERLRAATGLPLPVLSLGMSGDFAAAVAAGSTLVRIGSAVFGPRAG